MKVNLEMECSPSLNEDGTIEVGIWFGNDCEPSLEEIFLLKEMVDNTLEIHEGTKQEPLTVKRIMDRGAEGLFVEVER